MLTPYTSSIPATPKSGVEVCALQLPLLRSWLLSGQNILLLWPPASLTFTGLISSNLFCSSILNPGDLRASLLVPKSIISSFFMSSIISCTCVCVCYAQPCPTLCNLMDYSPPGSSVHGILQARILQWVPIPFSRGSSQPRDWTQVTQLVKNPPAMQGTPVRFLGWEDLLVKGSATHSSILGLPLWLSW